MTVLVQHARQSRHSPFWLGARHASPIAGFLLCTLLVVIPAIPAMLAGIFTGTSGYIADSRIVRFSGIDPCFATYDLTIAYSLVGSQCRVLGVARHISAIFSRCARFWISPLSCQRKYGSAPMLAIIESIHNGLSILSSLAN